LNGTLNELKKAMKYLLLLLCMIGCHQLLAFRSQIKRYMEWFQYRLYHAIEHSAGGIMRLAFKALAPIFSSIQFDVKSELFKKKLF